MEMPCNDTAIDDLLHSDMFQPDRGCMWQQQWPLHKHAMKSWPAALQCTNCKEMKWTLGQRVTALTLPRTALQWPTCPSLIGSRLTEAACTSRHSTCTVKSKQCMSSEALLSCHTGICLKRGSDSFQIADSSTF